MSNWKHCEDQQNKIVFYWFPEPLALEAIPMIHYKSVAFCCLAWVFDLPLSKCHCSQLIHYCMTSTLHYRYESNYNIEEKSLTIGGYEYEG